MRNFLLSFLIILATVFFALGIILPVIRFTTVYVWTNEHSIATIIWALYESNEYFLCAVVFAVSIFFPVPEAVLPADARHLARPVARVPPPLDLDHGMARPLLDDRRHGAGADDLLRELVGLHGGAS